MAKKTKKSQAQQKSPEQSAQRLESTRRRRLQGLLAEPGATGTGARRVADARSGPSARKARRAARNAPAPVVEDVLTADEPRYWEIAFFIFLIAIVLRQLWLAQAPFHPDEAIHGWFTVGFANYHYDPVYHGPLMYHLLAVVFRVFGDNDYTARLVPSLMGIGLIALVLGPLRRWMGPRAALWSAALLTISPVMVSYQRRLLHDALVMVLTLGSVLCLQAALENPAHTRRGCWARIGLAALLTLFIATKANAFFIIAMLFGFWLMVRLRPWLNRLLTNVSPPSSVSWLPMALFIIVSITSVLALRDEAVKERNELMLTLVCIAAVVALWAWMALGTYPAPSQVASQNAEEMEDSAAPSSSGRLPPALASIAVGLAAIGVAVIIFAFLFGRGYQWWKIPGQESQQAIESVQASLIEIKQALPKMVNYWGGQQQKPRLPGRHDYYIVLMTLYELPIVLAAIGGIVHAARRRSLFTDLLLWWAFTSFTLYALANEKVPWLLTHIMLPLILLAGWWLAHLRFATTGKRRAFAICCGLGAIFLLRGVSAVNFERAGDHHEPLLYAQTSEAFRDAFFEAMQKTQQDSGPIWVHNERQWPPAWYLRQGALYMNGSTVQYGASPGMGDLRLGMAPPLEWAKEPRVAGWSSKTADFYIWPRASWPALRPAVFANFWLNRTATVENGVLAAPGEWSHAEVVVGMPPTRPPQ